MQKENKRIDFNNQRFYVGIDTHKRQWTVTIRSNKMELKTYVTNPSPEELAKYLERNYPGGKYHSVYEAGFLGYWAHRRLEKLGIESKIAAPTEIPTSSKEKTAKKDSVDSRKLARELENGSIEGIYIPTELEQEFRSLVRQRYQITKAEVRLKNQIKGYLNFYGHNLSKEYQNRKWTGNFISYLKGKKFNYPMGNSQLEIYIKMLLYYADMKRELKEAILKYLKDYNLETTVKLLCTVPGIGLTTAIVFVSEIINITRFHSFDSLANYCGLIPAIRSSDEKQIVLGIKLQHNKQLRELLVESAWMAIRKDPALTAAYGNYKKRMPAQKAIIKIARKLLSRINYVWRQQKEYVCSVIK
jgi:transposase